MFNRSKDDDARKVELQRLSEHGIAVKRDSVRGGWMVVVPRSIGGGTAGLPSQDEATERALTYWAPKLDAYIEQQRAEFAADTERRRREAEQRAAEDAEIDVANQADGKDAGSKIHRPPLGGKGFEYGGDIYRTIAAAAEPMHRDAERNRWEKARWTAFVEAAVNAGLQVRKMPVGVRDRKLIDRYDPQIEVFADRHHAWVDWRQDEITFVGGLTKVADARMSDIAARLDVVLPESPGREVEAALEKEASEDAAETRALRYGRVLDKKADPESPLYRGPV